MLPPLPATPSRQSRSDDDVIEISTAMVHARLVPSFAGSLISLRFGSTEWLRSAYPRRITQSDGSWRVGGARPVFVGPLDAWSESIWAGHGPWTFRSICSVDTRDWVGHVLSGSPGCSCCHSPNVLLSYLAHKSIPAISMALRWQTHSSPLRPAFALDLAARKVQLSGRLASQPVTATAPGPLDRGIYAMQGPARLRDQANSVTMAGHSSLRAKQINASWTMIAAGGPDRDGESHVSIALVLNTIDDAATALAAEGARAVSVSAATARQLHGEYEERSSNAGLAP